MTWLETGKLPVLLAAAIALGGAGCVEASAHPLGTPPAPTDSASLAGDGSGPAEPGSDAALEPGRAAPYGRLLLRLSADPTSICPGECSLLHATLQAGRPPYSWQWDHDLPAEPGPHRVCPSSTTTYSLEVTDTAATDLEFPSPAARGGASATVVVRSSCGDAGQGEGMPRDAGLDPETPTQPAAACAIRIPVFPRNGDSPFIWGTAGSDAAGNLILAAVMSGSAQVGPGPRLVTERGVSRIFVAKYDASCNFQWLRWLGEPYETAEFGSMEVNAQGQVALSRTYFINVPLQVPDYRSQVLTLSRDGEISWSLDSAGGGLYHTALMHGLAWGHDGSLAVYGLPELCGTSEGGVCVAKVAASGKLAFGRMIGGAMGAGVTLDAAGNLIAAGVSNPQGIGIEGLPTVDGTPPFIYVAKFDSAGTPQWLTTTPLERDMPFNHTQGFASAARDGSVLVAWNDIGSGVATTRLVRAWRVSAAGVPSGLEALKIAEDNGSSEPNFTASGGAELLTAEYIDNDLKGAGATRGTTQLAWWRPDGSLSAKLELAESIFSPTSSIRLSASGQPILVSTELGSDNLAGAQALVLRRLERP
jgi:hypothetical protein